jgi:Tc5 transposase DNA-binding domain/Fission yeast centromere protein N-terminal domain
MLPTPSTLATVISAPRKRLRSSHHRGITDIQRRQLRQYWADAPADAKPTQVEIAAWFSAKFHPISQLTVSDSLKPTYHYLDEKKVEQPERLRRKTGSWPDLEAALYQWQLATNRKNNQVTGLLLQEMAIRFWLSMTQYKDFPVPKFSAGWLDAFKIRHYISRKKRYGEAGKVDIKQLKFNFTKVRFIIAEYSLADIYNIDEIALY